MQSIVYKSSRSKREITEEEALQSKRYFKNYYQDNVLIKEEYIWENEIVSIVSYFNKYQSIEECIFINLFIDCSFYYKLFDYDKFSVYLFQSYECQNLRSQAVIVRSNDKTLEIQDTFNFLTDSQTLTKTLKTSRNYSSLSRQNEIESYIKVMYFSNGDFDYAKFSNEDLSMHWNEFFISNNFAERYNLTFDKEYFRNFNSVIPDDNFSFPSITIHYIDSHTSLKIPFKEIFTKSLFQKHIFVNQKIKMKEVFYKGKIVESIFFLKTDETIGQFSSNLITIANTTFYHNPILDSNCTIWQVDVYDENQNLTEKRQEIYNFQNQLISLEYLFSTEKLEYQSKKFCYKNIYESILISIFNYDSEGSLIYHNDCEFFSDSIWNDDIDWGPYYLTEETFNKKISQPYFLDFYSERTQSSNQKVDIIYKDYSGTIIAETDIYSCFEYSKEVKIDHYVKEITKFKDKSCYYVEYYCDQNEKKTSYEFHNLEAFIAYNKRNTNGFTIYDFEIINSKDKRSDVEFGLLVQDKWGREITKVTYSDESKKIKSVTKKWYNNFHPEDVDFERGETVIFDGNSIVGYQNIFGEKTTNQEYLNKPFTDLEFYQSVYPFIPNFEMTFQEDLSFKTKTYRNQIENGIEQQVSCYYNTDGKLKLSRGNYFDWAFFKDITELDTKKNFLKLFNFDLFFYSIERGKNEVSFTFQYSLKLHISEELVVTGQFIINTETYSVGFDSNSTSLSLHKEKLETNYNLYFFYYNNKKIWFRPLFIDLLIEFMEQAI